MKYGIREVCDVTFTKKSGVGPTTFTVDTAKMSTLESASTTVYAQGGQGNSRHMAWEGEKTLTFTLEDALITLNAFEALTGAERTDASGKTVYTIKTTSFAGIYSVVATTLFRDESGNDHVATITIPKAKLQTNLNLSMAPTGDPASFTYTFDALADDADTLFTLTINEDSHNTGDSVTTVVIDNKVYTTTADKDIELKVDGTTGAVTLTGASVSGTTLSATDSLSDFVTVLKRGDSIEIKQGSTSTWHII